MAYKHILFDLDGTLWDFHLNSKETLEDLFQSINLASYLNCDFNTFHEKYVDINAKYWLLYGEKKISKDQLRYGRFNDTFRIFDYENIELAKELNDSYIQRAPHKTNLISGCIEALDYLNPKYDLHIVTNGFPEVQHIKLNNCGLTNYFKKLFISEDIGYNKPDQRIFQHIFDALKTDAKECIMIGDNWEADIEGAKGVGMDYIFVGETEEKTGKHPAIRDLSLLTSIL
jgi:putative hydrolase of the HAD superfamily